VSGGRRKPASVFPFAGLERPTGARYRVQAPRVPPVGLVRLQSLVCRTTRSLSGYLRRGAGTCFHVRRPLPRPTVPRPLRAGFMPSGRSSPSEFLRRSLRPLLSEVAVLPGVPSLFATSPKVSTHAEASRASATFRPQAFTASRRLAPPSATRACFIPQPRPGFLFRPGVSPNPQPSRLVTGHCLHAVVDRTLTGKPAATHDRLDFEALLCGTMRSSRRGLAAPSVAPLFGFSPPPGSHAAIVSRAHPVVRS